MTIESLCICRSREEMALWKEKQVQVAKEEAKVKESMEKLHRSAGRKKPPMTPRDKELQAKVTALLVFKDYSPLSYWLCSVIHIATDSVRLLELAPQSFGVLLKVGYQNTQ